MNGYLAPDASNFVKKYLGLDILIFGIGGGKITGTIKNINLKTTKVIGEEDRNSTMRRIERWVETKRHTCGGRYDPDINTQLNMILLFQNLLVCTSVKANH